MKPMSDPEKPRDVDPAVARDERAAGDPASLHQAIQQQIQEVLADAGLSEEEKQQILVALQCPCCGAGGLSVSIKLNSGGRPPSF